MSANVARSLGAFSAPNLSAVNITPVRRSRDLVRLRISSKSKSTSMSEAKEVEARVVDRHSASGALGGMSERTTTQESKETRTKKKEGYWQKSRRQRQIHSVNPDPACPISLEWVKVELDGYSYAECRSGHASCVRQCGGRTTGRIERAVTVDDCQRMTCEQPSKPSP